jgi:hypothetical protein
MDTHQAADQVTRFSNSAMTAVMALTADCIVPVPQALADAKAEGAFISEANDRHTFPRTAA